MHKKYNKKKLIGNLIIFGFLLIFVSYFDINIDKTNISLLAHENSFYKEINTKEMLHALEGETGVYLIVDNSEYTSRIINILNSLRINEKIYLYNINKEELILDTINNEIIITQNPTDNYNIFLSKIGAYKDNYVINNQTTNYYKINTPVVFFINNGSIIFSYYLSDDALDDEILSSIYLKGFNLLRTI